MILEVAASLLIVWLTWHVIKTYQERRTMPPGPFPLPFIGNLHQLGSNPPFTMDNLWKKYGDVYTVNFPVGTYIIVNTGNLMREALVTRKDDYAGRPISALYPAEVTLEGRDIATADYGPPLIFRRKVFATAAHIFGEGVLRAEKRLNSAAEDLWTQIRETNEKAFSFKDYVSTPITIQFVEWLFGIKCTPGHPLLALLMEFNKIIDRIYRPGNIYQVFPFMRRFPTKYMKDVKRYREIREELFQFQFEDHCRTYRNDGAIRDMTDAFLASYEKEKSREGGKGIGSKDDIKFLMTDVIFAGVDTSSALLTWFIAFMVLNEDVQMKLHQELDEVVGKERLPLWEDKENLPFLQAVICEVLRLSPFSPFILPHKTIRDTTIQGYTVPMDTVVLFNLHRIHKDLNEWDEPSLFKPERFIDPNGKFIGWTTLPSFLPFSVGRRICPGEEIGKMQLFVIASRLLHQFKFKVASDEPKPSLEPLPGLVWFPKEFKVIAITRTSSVV